MQIIFHKLGGQESMELTIVLDEVMEDMQNRDLEQNKWY
jgi:hypothetical protein